MRQFRPCRGHQLKRTLWILPELFQSNPSPLRRHMQCPFTFSRPQSPIPPIAFNPIVTCCNKLKLTKSVRQCAMCNVQRATGNGATCDAYLVASVARFVWEFGFSFGFGVGFGFGFFFSFFGARLDNKCQHLAAANLFAPPMRSPQEGRPDRRIDLMAARVGTPISDRATGWKSEGIVRGERDF